MWCMLALLTGPWSGPVWALAANSVTVDGSTAARKGEYFEQPVNVANTGGALWRSVAVTSGGSSSICAFAFLKYQATPTYDLDGNLTFDGVWNYQWDAENRLRSMNMTNITAVPNAERKKLDFLYDDEGRRVMKAVSVWNGSAFANPVTNWFVYDGWNLAGELSVTADGCVELVRSYTWGLDLSGSLDGAGGIGGLVLVTDYATGTSYFPAYDGNGNILALVNAADGSVAAQYEYSPFGELIRSTGTMAKANPFRWSTKYWDEETGLVYYGYRYYSPTMGRWISRDPIEEEGGNNLYAFVGNTPINSYDLLGMDGTLLEEEAAGGIASGLGEGIAQGMSIYMRVKNAVDTFNTVQEFGVMMMDADPDNADEMLMGVAQVGARMLVDGLVKKATPVVGRVKQLDQYRDNPAYNVFGGWKGGKGPGDHFSDLRRNVNWLRDIVKSGSDVLIADPKDLGKYSAMEIKYLLKRGYKQIGNKLVKQ